MKKLPLLAFGAAALLAIPASASAATLCVSKPAADCTTQFTSGQLQLALTTAQNNNQDNTVRIGAGTYTGAFTYAGNSHVMSIEGSGRGVTSINVPNNAAAQAALATFGPAVTVQDLDVLMSATNSAGDIGLDLTLTDARRVHVIGNGSDNTTGVRLLGGSLNDSSVDQSLVSPSGNIAVFTGGNASMSNSALTGVTTVDYSAPGATLNMSGMNLRASSRGIETDGGTINIDDTLIDLGNADAIGLFA